MFAKFKIYIAIGLMLAGAASIAYWYYKESQAEIARLNKAIEKHKIANAENKKTIDNLKSNIIEIQKNLTLLNVQNTKALEESLRLRKILNEHRLEFLASEKPKLIERRVNAATKKVFKDFENITKQETYYDKSTVGSSTSN